MSESSKSWDPVWETVFSNQEWGKYPSEYVIRFVARNFYKSADRSKVRLLDLGCGPGANTWYMAREGFAAAGIDGSETAVQRANERLQREGLNADVRCGDYVQLPWPDNYFDAVVDNVTLYCNRFAQGISAVNEVKRVLKPGGRFLSANFTDRCWGYGLGREVEPGAFVDIQEGPLVGKGLALFMSRSQVDILYRDFVDKTLDLLSYTVAGHMIELWIVQCQKGQSE
jgi:SAM-dependent methyltransferase